MLAVRYLLLGMNERTDLSLYDAMSLCDMRLTDQLVNVVLLACLRLLQANCTESFAWLFHRMPSTCLEWGRPISCNTSPKQASLTAGVGF